MFAKIWNWFVLLVMLGAGFISIIASFASEWDKATYFLLIMVVGKIALDDKMEIE